MNYKKNLGLFILIISIGFASFSQSLVVSDLSAEYKNNPIGIDVIKPRLAWKIGSAERNVMQTAYQVKVAFSKSDLMNDNGLLWNSGKVTSDKSVQVVFDGKNLESRKRYYWTVKVWDNLGNSSDWSEPAFWEVGLLKADEWVANWIQPDIEEDLTKSEPSPYLRKDFKLKGDIKKARIYISSFGLYEAEINGKKVGNQLFTPGWTSYNNRLQYQVYDVLDHLENGKNAIGVVLGDGWYRGNLGWADRKNVYGEDLALIAQLEITYSNGKVERILSDESWKCATGPIVMSDIYNGEIYDSRLEKPGWSNSGYKDKDWSGVKLVDRPKDKLVAAIGPPVRKIQEINPISIIKSPLGETIIDMGQNMVGWVRLKVQGPEGTVVTLLHAEVLDKEGNFYIDNLRSAKQMLQYTLNGKGQEVYEPNFTFQGFRYVKVEGFPGELSLDNITGVVIHSDFAITGTFACSNPLLNQLQHNIQWGQKGNFLDVPTDCPQRDERMGWTGDAQVFSRAASFNADVAAFYTKWLKDMEADQLENGSIPHVIPNVLGKNSVSSAGWADASTIIPWNMYLVYGDKRILDEQYSSMANWVSFMTTVAGEDHLWNKGSHFGDWLFYRPNDDNSGMSAVTDKYLIAQSFYIHSTEILRNSARILGKKDDVEKYDELLKEIKQAYLNEYVTPNGRLISSTQTAYVLALEFDLLPENVRKRAAERLVENIGVYKDHITTGFLGTPYLCDVLSEYGYVDVAYKLLLQESYPSWLYPVKMGATTIWERWDGIKPDSTFQTPNMNSFNHYAYGAIGDWMYKNIVGIDLDENDPGYKNILIKPTPGGEITKAEGEYESYYGTIKSGWKIEGGKIVIDVSIPVNTKARVKLPKAHLSEVLESGNKLETIKYMNSKQTNEDVIIELGSGNFKFEYPYKLEQ